jgi:hypothetical protein
LIVRIGGTDRFSDAPRNVNLVSLNFETADANELLHSALGICSNEISAKNLRIELKIEAIEHRIRADGARLQQVFWNLIKNAVKFTPPDGRLQLGSSNPPSSWFRLEVIDSGIGIASDVLPRIFDPFEQGDRAGSGGLGLGLTIYAIVPPRERLSQGLNRGVNYADLIVDAGAPHNCIYLATDIAVARRSLRCVSRLCPSSPALLAFPSVALGRFSIPFEL